VGHIHILLADNDLAFLETWSEFLESNGYTVHRASTPAEARSLLETAQIHLAILDLRLTNDDDDNDRSGLIVAKEAARHIPKLILTKFPTFEAVRDALRLDFETLPPAVDFINKKDDLDTLLQIIIETTEKYIQINWELIIRWGETLSWFQIVDFIESGENGREINSRETELEELFRRLFYNSHQVTISRLLAQQDETVLLAVHAFSLEGRETQLLVLCSNRHHIQMEEEQYDRFFSKVTAEGGLHKQLSAQTAHYGAMAFIPPGGQVSELLTLVHFYRQASIETMVAALAYFLKTGLAPWHTQGQFMEEEKSFQELVLAWPNLTEETLSQQYLEAKIEVICRQSLTAGLARCDVTSHTLTLHRPDGEPVVYPNPAANLSEIFRMTAPPFLCGLTYGRLSGSTILVNPLGQSWPLGFSHTTQGLLLRDFVSLETIIKFEIATGLTLEARQDMEHRLLKQDHLAQPLEVAEPTEQYKLYQAIQTVRQHAVTIIGHDLNTYLAGLFFRAVCYLVMYDPSFRYTRAELMPYLHCLISMAEICHKLTSRTREGLPQQAQTSLWLDETNREVWVEGRLVNLAPKEFEFLSYLYRRPNQICSRSDIAQAVFDIVYDPALTVVERRQLEEGPINSTISRMRRKIEPSPRRPKYIFSVRGEGYRLALEEAGS
jgi:DNA-binding response OmpR family regulator